MCEYDRMARHAALPRRRLHLHALSFRLSGQITEVKHTCRHNTGPRALEDLAAEMRQMEILTNTYTGFAHSSSLLVSVNVETSKNGTGSLRLMIQLMSEAYVFLGGEKTLNSSMSGCD